MNKLLAIVYILLFAVLFVLAKPIDCFATAAIESRFLHLGYFIDVFLKEWNDPTDISFSDAIEVVKETWNGNYYP